MMVCYHQHHLDQTFSSPSQIAWSQKAELDNLTCRLSDDPDWFDGNGFLPQYQADNIGHRDGKYHLNRPQYLRILNNHHLHFYDRLINSNHLHSYNRLIDLWTDDPDGADGNDLRQTRKPQELPGKFRHSQFIPVSLMSMSLSLSSKLYLCKTVTKSVVYKCFSLNIFPLLLYCKSDAATFVFVNTEDWHIEKHSESALGRVVFGKQRNFLLAKVLAKWQGTSQN